MQQARVSSANRVKDSWPRRLTSASCPYVGCWYAVPRGFTGQAMAQLLRESSAAQPSRERKAKASWSSRDCSHRLTLPSARLVLPRLAGRYRRAPPSTALAVSLGAHRASSRGT